MSTATIHISVPGLENLRLVRLRTVELIAPLSQQELDIVPAPGKWSVGEIADHIVLAADSLQDILQELIRMKRNGQQPFVKRGFSEFDVFFAFLPKSLMPVMEMPLSLVSRFVPENVRNFLIEHQVLPFHAPTSGTPRHGLPAQELIDRLLASWDKINSAFQDNADLDFQEMAVQHPMFGYITMTNLPDLMAGHEIRHQKQIVESGHPVIGLSGHRKATRRSRPQTEQEGTGNRLREQKNTSNQPQISQMNADQELK